MLGLPLVISQSTSVSAKGDVKMLTEDTGVSISQEMVDTFNDWADKQTERVNSAAYETNVIRSQNEQGLPSFGVIVPSYAGYTQLTFEIQQINLAGEKRLCCPNGETAEEMITFAAAQSSALMFINDTNYKRLTTKIDSILEYLVGCTMTADPEQLAISAEKIQRDLLEQAFVEVNYQDVLTIVTGIVDINDTSYVRISDACSMRSRFDANPTEVTMKAVLICLAKLELSGQYHKHLAREMGAILQANYLAKTKSQGVQIPNVIEDWNNNTKKRITHRQQFLAWGSMLREAFSKFRFEVCVIGDQHRQLNIKLGNVNVCDKFPTISLQLNYGIESDGYVTVDSTFARWINDNYRGKVKTEFSITQLNVLQFVIMERCMQQINSRRDTENDKLVIDPVTNKISPRTHPPISIYSND